MKDIVVVGLGVFGREIAIQLEKKGNHVLAVDLNPDDVDRIKDHVTGAVVADVTDEDALKELEISKFDLVILGIGSNFEQLVLGATHLKRLKVKYIIARATTEIQKEILLRIGADEVILPEKQSAVHLAARISVPNILEYLELDKDINLTEIHVDHRLAGKTLVEVDLRQKYHITALILKRKGQQPKIISNPDITLMIDDCLVVFGKQEDIEHYFS